MLERFKQFISTGGKTEITEERGEAKSMSKSLSRCVTFLLAGAIAFNSLASFGAVIAGDHLAKMEHVQLEQRFDNTVNNIQGVLDTYHINKTGIDGPTKNVAINGVRITDMQVQLSNLMTAVHAKKGDLEGSFAQHTEKGGLITIDSVELEQAGLGTEFGTLHEIGHSLITYTDNYAEMHMLASGKLNNSDARGLLSVYAESHADAYAVLKIAQVKGVDAALQTAHKVYDARKGAGDFNAYSHVSNSHDSGYALEKVTDFLMHNADAKGMSDAKVYQLSVDYGLQSMNHWVKKHNIPLPEKTAGFIADSAIDSLELINNQNINMQFSDVSYSDNYMQLLSDHLLSSKFMNQQERMVVNVDNERIVQQPQFESTWSSYGS